MNTPSHDVDTGMKTNMDQPFVVEPSLLQARWYGTLYQTASTTRLSAAAALRNYLRLTSSTVTQHTQCSRDAV